MDWRVVVLTAADSAIGGMSVIQGLFDRIWMALPGTKGHGTLRSEPDGGPDIRPRCISHRRPWARARRS
jgi:hypothetical protein